MLKKVGIYMPFLKSVIQRALVYKFSFVMWLFSSFLQMLVAWYLWVAIYQSSGTGLIEGFSFVEMQVFVLMSFVVRKFTSSSVDWQIAEDIHKGTISGILIKPINYTTQLIFTSIGELIVNFSIVFLPIWSITTFIQVVIYNNSFPEITSIVLFIISIILSVTLTFLIDYIVGLCAFFVTYIWGFIVCKYSIISLLSGAIIPLVLFDETIRKILTYLPFASLNYIPVMIYMNKLSFNEISFYLLIQIIWIIIFILICKKAWKLAIKKITIAGG